MSALHIQAVGAFAATGGNAAAVMGGILTGFQLFDDLELDGPDGEPLGGGITPVPRSMAGTKRLSALGFLALAECAENARHAPAPLIVISPPEAEMGDDPESLVDAIIQSDATLPVERGASRVIPRGREAIAEALTVAEQLLQRGPWEECYVVGVDSLIAGKRLQALVRQGLVLHRKNPDGFVPGEAAAALRVSRRSASTSLAAILGSATSNEPAGKDPRAAPLLGIGLATAAERALVDARRSQDIEKLAAIVTDRMGPQVYFEEIALACMRPPVAGIELRSHFHPALSVGDVGAASGVLGIAALAFFMHKQLVQEAAACLFSADLGWRAAVVMAPSHRTKGRNNG